MTSHLALALLLSSTALLISMFHVYILRQLCQRVVELERKVANAHVSISTTGGPSTGHTHHAHVRFD